MGSILALVTTLISGGAVAGLTLAQWEAIIGFVLANEPKFEQFIKTIAALEPGLYDALTKDTAKIAANMRKPVPTIPGYGKDGGVVDIDNPDTGS